MVVGGQEEDDFKIDRGKLPHKSRSRVPVERGWWGGSCSKLAALALQVTGSKFLALTVRFVGEGTVIVMNEWAVHD